METHFEGFPKGFCAKAIQYISNLRVAFATENDLSFYIIVNFKRYVLMDGNTSPILNYATELWNSLKLGEKLCMHAEKLEEVRWAIKYQLYKYLKVS